MTGDQLALTAQMSAAADAAEAILGAAVAAVRTRLSMARSAGAGHGGANESAPGLLGGRPRESRTSRRGRQAEGPVKRQPPRADDPTTGDGPSDGKETAE